MKHGPAACRGKGLARYMSRGSIRFQPLPIGTAREVFPQQLARWVWSKAGLPVIRPNGKFAATF